MKTHLHLSRVCEGDANVVVAQLKGRNLVPENEIKGIPSVQIQETPLSDFFHEVMLYYSKADVVAHQIDNDNARLDVGPIKKKILHIIINMLWVK